MITHLRQAVGISAIFFVLLGIAYPLSETAIGQGLFSHQANGSLTANGSTIIGQTWSSPDWFVGRPDTDNPMASGGTNLGPRSKALVSDVTKQISALRREGIKPTNDLVTTSGSGIDPDITATDAYAQVAAVAKARHLPVTAVRQLVKSMIHQPEFGFLGSSYIDLLQLNEALARMR
jgi:K+-transporting ATPase ATPase C chain